MWAMFVLAIAASAIGLTQLTRSADQPRSPGLRSDAIAVNMIAFDREAAKFAIANKPYTGSLDASNLPLPGWYRPIGGWRTDVFAGVYMVTYPTALSRPAPDMVAALLRHREGQMLIGINGGPTQSSGNSNLIGRCLAVATATRGCEHSVALAKLMENIPLHTPVIVRKLTP